MTLSYNFGLTAGSLVAYVLDAMLGPPLAAPCRAPPRFVTPFPFVANLSAPFTLTVSTAVVNLTTALTTATTALTSLSTVHPTLVAIDEITSVYSNTTVF